MAVQPLPSAGRVPTTRPERPGMHVLAWILGGVALLAAALGLWMVLAEDGAALTVTIPLLIDDTWAAAEVRDFWAPLLLMGGGLVTAVLFGLASRASFRARTGRVLPAVELLLALAGVAAIAVGAATLL